MRAWMGAWEARVGNAPLVIDHRVAKSRSVAVLFHWTIGATNGAGADVAGSTVDVSKPERRLKLVDHVCTIAPKETLSSWRLVRACGA